nr:hypothetical protein [Tanacetum cinerariifolium]
MRLKDVLMMVLVMHTEEDDMVLHTEKTGMLMLVVEIDVGGMTTVKVDKLTCSSDDVGPKQVDLRRESIQELHVYLKLFQFYIVVFILFKSSENLRGKSLENDVCSLDVTIGLNGFCC